MSPTRRGLLKLSAGAVAMALTASAVSGRSATAAAPEAIRLASVETVMVMATMTDGRQASIGFQRWPDFGDGVGPRIGAICTIGETQFDADAYSLDDDMIEALDRSSGWMLLSGLERAGFEVQR
jgi:hypothetical protein